MYHYEYVSKNQAMPYKKNVINLLHAVQDEVRDYFTFQYWFIGSSSRNMITFDPHQNTGFDFDVNITVNDDNENYSPVEIRNILFNAFSKVMCRFGFNKCEHSTRVITLKNTDTFNSKIKNSCDFAIVYETHDGQQYIRYNKKTNQFQWVYQEQPNSDLEQRAETLKRKGFWNEALEVYLNKKNNNTNPDKHSRSLYAETINECYSRHKS